MSDDDIKNLFPHNDEEIKDFPPNPDDICQETVKQFDSIGRFLKQLEVAKESGLENEFLHSFFNQIPNFNYNKLVEYGYYSLCEWDL